MIIFLYGSDSYRRQQKLKEVVSQYTSKHKDVPVQIFDALSQPEFLLAGLREQSLFGAVQFIVAQNFSELSKELIKPVALALQHILTTKEFIVVIISDGKPIKDFEFLLQSPVITQEFPQLTSAAFEEFIKREASRRKAKLTPQLLLALRDRFIGDAWGLVSELDTLALGGEMSVESPILGFLDIQRFFRTQDIQTSLPLLERLLLNQDSGYIFNACAYQTSGVTKAQFANYDVAVKSGKSDYDTVLLDFVLADANIE